VPTLAAAGARRRSHTWLPSALEMRAYPMRMVCHLNEEHLFRRGGAAYLDHLMRQK
jgi:hypothetical protein